MIICPKCGHQNQDGTRWCTACNSYLEWTEPTSPKEPSSVLTVWLAPSDVAVQSGGEATCEARVRNGGTIVDEAIFEVTGEAAAWAVVEPARLSLMPGQELTAVVRFRPPRSSAVRAGKMPFGVRVRSSVAGSAVVDEKAGSIAVGAFTEIGAIIVPETSEGLEAAEHTVTVQNEGNVPVEINLSADDPEDILSFELQPARHVVEPGGAAAARLRVWRRQGVSRPGQRLPFQVVAEPTGVTPVIVQGAFRQLPQPEPVSNKRRSRTWMWLLGIAGTLVLAGVGAAIAIAVGGPHPPVSTSSPPPTTLPPTTPPPTTPPPTTPPPLQPVRIEAEAQRRDSNVPALVSPQGDCCGVHWSGGQQLWFRATTTGQYVTVFLNVDRSGTYRVDVRLTKAPDYGIYSLELDGRTLVTGYQGYVPGTVGSTVTTDVVPLAGRTQLSAGPHNLTIRVTGKSPNSLGYQAGIDYIDLTPQ